MTPKIINTASAFKNVQKILVIKFRHIGDVLLTVPTIRALKETFPGARVSVLVNSGTEDVLTGNPLIDELLVFDRTIKKLSMIKRLLKEFHFIGEIRAEGFDIAVDLTGGDRAAIFSFLSGARYRLAADPGKKGFIGKRHLYTHLAHIDKQKHMVFQNLDVVKHFGITTDNTNVDFFIPEEAKIFVKRIFEENNITPPGGRRGVKVIHVHPTSRWLFKCWKDEYMAEAIGWLIDRGVKVLVTSSPESKEIEKAKKILSLVSSRITHYASRVLDLCGKTTIKQLAAVSEASDLFIGVDSAPMHIAAAVGTPVVALFGPSGAFHWGPWDNNYRQKAEGRRQKLEVIPYSRRNGIQTFGIHTVIQKDRECAPCGKDGCKGSKISQCLEEITPDEIVSILIEKLRDLKQ